MSSSGAEHTTAANRSGRWVNAAPTSRPPLEPPQHASCAGVVQPSATSRSATAWKSSNTFRLCARIPARCQSSPSSPPPRRFATTYTPPASTLAWVEAGGVYVVANLRGGGEEGEDWHRAGMRAHKRNVFDDFHAVAERLVADGWTTPAQLACWGGSNGGLLVGAALTQRPDLFAAVVCSAPLLDMVRYQRFGLGVTWSEEYGDADTPRELAWLLGYSPYHRAVDATEPAAYPATLFTVFEGDTRVDPLHARKLAAALRASTSVDRSTAPILVRRETGVGHGGRALSRTISLTVEQLQFVADRTGLTGGAR